ncbi:MAG: hypothetical protein JHD04_15330, partial [Nocardioides sp.]|nr:hypothetical protein [Nocardioides sp.]
VTSVDDLAAAGAGSTGVEVSVRVADGRIHATTTRTTRLEEPTDA